MYLDWNFTNDLMRINWLCHGWCEEGNRDSTQMQTTEAELVQFTDLQSLQNNEGGKGQNQQGSPVQKKGKQV